MAKIAVELERALAERALNGGPGNPTARLLAQGEGWSVQDVVCTSGPHDHPFEERHSRVSIALVVAGSFQYRAWAASSELMTPGSVLLGSPGQCFECGHQHGMGDRCISFGYTPEYFESLIAGAGIKRTFSAPRLPPLRALSALVARACSGVMGACAVPWEELGVELAARTLPLASGSPEANAASPGALRRVTLAVRAIERHPDTGHTLASLARDARLSPYHFLRTFQLVTGVTPHQFILRARLREAALKLAEPERVLDIALDCGFGDLSNFNRSFRAEFGVSPRAFRRRI